MPTFVSRLRQLRAERGWSQADCAAKLGIQRSSWANWEVGRAEPNMETLQLLASMFNVTLDYLLGRSDARHAMCDVSRTSLDALLYDRDLWCDGRVLTAEDKHIVLAVIRALRNPLCKEGDDM